MEIQPKILLGGPVHSPRRVPEFIKEFSTKHQGVFQKVLHLFKKALSSFSR